MNHDRQAFYEEALAQSKSVPKERVPTKREREEEYLKKARESQKRITKKYGVKPGARGAGYKPNVWSKV